MKYLGLLIDWQLTWLSAVNARRPHSARVLEEVRQLLARANGCSQQVAQRLCHGMASTVVLYVLLLAYWVLDAGRSWI